MNAVGKIVHVNVPYAMIVQRIDFAAEHGLRPEIFLSGDDLDSCTEEDVRSVACVLREKGLEATIHGPFMDLSPGAVDRRVREVTFSRFLRTIELARFFRPRSVVFHAGYEKWRFDEKEDLWLRGSIETWRPLVEVAKAWDLVISVENVFEDSPQPLRRLLETIDSEHFRLCFDTGHHNAFSHTPVALWLEALKPFLWEVHLHDNHGKRDEHLPAGDGTFDFRGFFELLSSNGLDPILTIEPHEEPHLWRGLNAVSELIQKRIS